MQSVQPVAEGCMEVAVQVSRHVVLCQQLGNALHEGRGVKTCEICENLCPSTTNH